MNAIYSVTSYSYLRDDLSNNDMRKCIDPLDVMYSRPQNKWDRVMLLVLDQAKITLLPASQKILEAMTQLQDKRAFERWHSMLDKAQMQKLVDKYQEYGKHVVDDKWKPIQPSVAPEIERPPSGAASSSHHAQAHEREHQRKGDGKGQIYGHAGRRTWEQTNRYARDWKPAAMNVSSYGATFRDATWTHPRHRRDRYWDEPYWDPNIRITRRSWREWDQDREEEQHEHGEQDHEEENDT